MVVFEKNQIQPQESLYLIFLFVCRPLRQKIKIQTNARLFVIMIRDGLRPSYVKGAQEPQPHQPTMEPSRKLITKEPFAWVEEVGRLAADSR